MIDFQEAASIPGQLLFFGINIRTGTDKAGIKSVVYGIA